MNGTLRFQRAVVVESNPGFFSMLEIDAARMLFPEAGSLDPEIIAQREADEKHTGDRKEVLPHHQQLIAFRRNGQAISPHYAAL
jgi:hypothetical protein